MKKRSIIIDGHYTSVSMEDAFWLRFKKIAAEIEVPVASLAECVIKGSDAIENQSSAIRVFVIDWYANDGEWHGQIARQDAAGAGGQRSPATEQHAPGSRDDGAPGNGADRPQPGDHAGG